MGKKSGYEVATTNGELPTAVDNLKILKDELKELRTITETQYKTDGLVDGFKTGIQNETSIDVLTKMHSSILGRANAYDNSTSVLAKRLGGSFQVPVFKMNGHSVESLEDDIVLRIQVLSVEERKKTLEALVKEGEKFLTEKDQFQMYLQRVNAAIGTKS